MSSLRSSDQENTGMTIFLDVFRRANKKDDGFISWEEFVTFFADGVLSKDELRALFNEIDTHNTHNIDTGELCSYFSQHLGDFKEIFKTCEDLGQSLTKVLYSTVEVYKTADKTGQFIMRFLMREIINQLSALQHPLEAAAESLDDQARKERGDTVPVNIDDVRKGDGNAIIPGRVGRRAKRQVSSQSTTSEGPSPAIAAQVERLASLLDKMETKVNFDHFRDEEVVLQEDDTVLLVQQEFPVKEDCVEKFRAVLRSYVDVTQGFNGCFNISVRDLRYNHSFCIYEVWASEDQYQNHSQSAAQKSFTEASADLLNGSVKLLNMKIPGTWWKRKV